MPPTYAAGDNFDDTDYPVPHCASRVEVRLFYQTTTKAYAEFLRDSLGGTNLQGIDAYDQWFSERRGDPDPRMSGAHDQPTDV